MILSVRTVVASPFVVFRKSKYLRLCDKVFDCKCEMLIIILWIFELDYWMYFKFWITVRKTRYLFPKWQNLCSVAKKNWSRKFHFCTFILRNHLSSKLYINSIIFSSRISYMIFIYVGYLISRRILNCRDKYEYRLMRRNKIKSDFTDYVTFMKSIIKKVEKVCIPLLSHYGFDVKQITFCFRWSYQVQNPRNLLINIHL